MNDDQKKTTQHAKGQVKSTVSALFDFLSSPNTKRWVEDNIAEPLDKLEEKTIEVKGETITRNADEACGFEWTDTFGKKVFCILPNNHAENNHSTHVASPNVSHTSTINSSPFCGHCGSSKLTPFCPKCGKKT